MVLLFPPLALASRGVGEATVALITAGLVPATAYYLQASTLSVPLWVVCLPFFPLAFAASIATALPDVDADRATGKRTSAVRMGRRRAVGLLVAMVVTGWALLTYVVASPESGVGPLALLPAPILVGAITLFAPAAARDSGDAAKKVAIAAVANLGWASLATSVLLL